MIAYIMNMYIYSKLFSFAVTELPVNCPDFSDTVMVDAVTDLYEYSDPTFGPSDVELLSDINFYDPHGGAYTVTYVLTPLPGATSLPAGTYTLSTIIADDELQKTCDSTIVVEGNIFSFQELFERLTEWSALSLGFIKYAFRHQRTRFF